MKSRNLSIGLIVFIVIAGLTWLFYYSAKPNQRLEANNAPNMPKIEMPNLAPTQIVNSSAPVIAKSVSADAQSSDQPIISKSQAVAEVHAYIDKVTGLLQSGDIVNAMEITESPEMDAKFFPNPEIKGKFYKAVQKDWAEPSRQHYNQDTIQHLLSLKNQTPSINDAGTEVTYFWSGVVFTKIDGVWYITKGRGF